MLVNIALNSDMHLCTSQNVANQGLSIAACLASTSRLMLLDSFHVNSKLTVNKHVYSYTIVQYSGTPL